MCDFYHIVFTSVRALAIVVVSLSMMIVPTCTSFSHRSFSIPLHMSGSIAFELPVQFLRQSSVDGVFLGIFFFLHYHMFCSIHYVLQNVQFCQFLYLLLLHILEHVNKDMNFTFVFLHQTDDFLHKGWLQSMWMY